MNNHPIDEPFIYLQWQNTHDAFKFDARKEIIQTSDQEFFIGYSFIDVYELFVCPI